MDVLHPCSIRRIACSNCICIRRSLLNIRCSIHEAAMIILGAPEVTYGLVHVISSGVLLMTTLVPTLRSCLDEFGVFLIATAG